jgi:hypothetical protein
MLASETCLAEHKVSAAISGLVKKGWVERRRRGQASSVYRVLRQSEVTTSGTFDAAPEVPDPGTNPPPEVTTPGTSILREQEEEKKNTSPGKAKAKKKEGEEKEVSDFRQVTDHFTKLFREHYHGERSPDWGAKQAGLVKKDLQRVNGDVRVLKVAQELFFDGDVRKVKEFCAQAGYEYGVFHGMLGAILEYMRREEEAGRADW